MMGALAHAKVQTIRALAAATLGLSLGVSGAASAATLQDMFGPSTFTQDGLTFSNFTPVLSGSLPTGDQLIDTLRTNPLDLLSIPFLDLSGSGTFSHGWGNASAADAGNIGLTVLPDNTLPASPGIDPGFQLEGNGEWSVDATNGVASAQLSAFAYTVAISDPAAQPINSADLAQSSTIDALGPDVFPINGWPDVAGGFALQLILDPNSTDLSTAMLNATMHGEVNQISLIEQFKDGTAIPNTDTIRVVNVFGIGASSGGGFTLDTVEQRIDPPLSAVPLPAAVWLFGTGLLGLAGIVRRRKTIG